jgi:hypothetical protein
MPSFIVTNFVQESPSGKAYQSTDSYTSGYVINKTGYDEFQEGNLPDGELALYPGMHIKSKDDDQVGKLDELVLDFESDDITHLLDHLRLPCPMIVVETNQTAFDSIRRTPMKE